MRFLSFLAFVFLFQFSSAYAQTSGVSLRWTCDKENRGELPKDKDIVAYYDEAGVLKYKPDIFKLPFRPLELLHNRGTSDLSDCIKNFTAQIPAAVAIYKVSCNGRTEKLCTQEDASVAAELKMKIRESKFYHKYQSALSSAEVDLGPKATAPAVAPGSNKIAVLPFLKKIEQKIADFVAPKKTPPVSQTTTTTTVATQPPFIPGRQPMNPEAPADSRQPFRTDADRPTNFSQLNPASAADVEDEKRQIQSFIVNHPEFGQYTDYLWRCTGESGGKNAGGPYCKPKQEKYDHLLGQLSQLVNRLPPGVLRKPVTDDKLSDTFLCLLPREAGNRMPGIEDFLGVVNQPDMCEDLKNSESKLMSFDGHSYLLKRKANGDFEATVNINFDFQSGALDPGGMLNKVRACLNSVAPFMLGPDKTSHLQINVKTPAEIEREFPIGSRPELKTIHVVNKNFFDGTGVAGNTENFREDFDCPGITHEFFHHLGMADEYPDRREQVDPVTHKSWKDLYSCRIVPEYPSVMNNPWDAFSRGMTTKKVCECQAEGCRILMRGADANSANLRGIMNSPTPSELFGFDHLKFCKSTALPLTNVMRNPNKSLDIQSQSTGNVTFESRNVVFIGSVIAYNRSKVECHCPDGDAACAQAFSKGLARYAADSEASQCPTYTQLVPNTNPDDLPDTSGAHEGKLLIVKKPSIPSLIAPNQFGKVLFGNCPTGPAGTYDYCDKYARVQKGTPLCDTKRPDATGNQCLGVQ